MVSLQSNLETSFLNCNCCKRTLKYIDKVGLWNCCSKEILVENTQINVGIGREMYSGLSMVNDETYGNVLLGSLYQTYICSQKFLQEGSFHSLDTHCPTYLLHVIRPKSAILLYKIKGHSKCPGILNRATRDSVKHVKSNADKFEHGANIDDQDYLFGNVHIILPFLLDKLEF